MIKSNLKSNSEYSQYLQSVAAELATREKKVHFEEKAVIVCALAIIVFQCCSLVAWAWQSGYLR